MSQIVLVGRPRLAQRILQEEMEARYGQSIACVMDCSRQGAWIALGCWDELPQWHAQLDELNTPGKEGFRLCVLGRDPLRVVICGADERGCLYGAGRLLRMLEIRKGSVCASDDLRNLSFTPASALRGHQLAYRDKQNTLPAWTEEEFDRYIRELALCGANAIEILPPRTDDRLFSPLFREHPLTMMTHLSQIIHEYGLDVWLWYPCMGKDYRDPAIFQAELEEREIVFAALPYLDGILIPTGDPGELAPRDFFEVAGSMMSVALHHHPGVKIYVAPQCFAPDNGWLDAFYSEVRRELPWLYGVCYAPWIQDTLPEMTAKLPEKFRARIRHYPDITHTAASQFDVPLWDWPLAILNGRESCCPRPHALKTIHDAHYKYCIGSITYSEGIHDDINKIVWADLDGDPDADIEESLRGYVRFLVSADVAKPLSDLILALEQNWKGKAEDNAGIEKTFAAFCQLDKELDDEVRDNWRYRMLYQRAMLDAYARRRYQADQALEQEARNVLAQAPTLGADCAVRQARAVMNRTFNEPTAEELRFRLQELGQKLFMTPYCRTQQSTVLHRAQAWIRGAWLDTLHTPLNDMQYFTCHFTRILNLTSEEEKQEAIRNLLHREDPGRDGRYIHLGSIDGFRQCVVSDVSYAEDPGMLRSPSLFHDLYGLMMRFHGNRGWYSEFPIPMALVHAARTLYGTPLHIRVDGLKPGSRYVLQVTYPDMIGQTRDAAKIALYADGYLVHDLLLRNACAEDDPVYRFKLPAPVGENGIVDLVWQAYGELVPVAVSEVWLKCTDEGGRVQ